MLRWLLRCKKPCTSCSKFLSPPETQASLKTKAEQMLTNENIADCDEMETIIQTPAALTTKQGKQ